jgi:ribosomal protein S18 acetylase RimI-like enzyme
VAPHAWIVHAHEPTRLLYERLGFSPIAYSHIMNISLVEEPPPPVWPEGITLRTFRELPDLRRVFLAEEACFRDHRGHVERDPEPQIAHWQHMLDANPRHDPDLWFLAMDGDEIAGISLCDPYVGDDTTLGLVDTLGVRREWRRRGLGLALLLHSFHALRKRGNTVATLDVDAQSLTGATRLYEKAGMHVHRRMAVYEREVRPGREISIQSL